MWLFSNLAQRCDLRDKGYKSGKWHSQSFWRTSGASTDRRLIRCGLLIMLFVVCGTMDCHVFCNTSTFLTGAFAGSVGSCFDDRYCARQKLLLLKQSISQLLADCYIDLSISMSRKFWQTSTLCAVAQLTCSWTVCLKLLSTTAFDWLMRAIQKCFSVMLSSTASLSCRWACTVLCLYLCCLFMLSLRVPIILLAFLVTKSI